MHFTYRRAGSLVLATALVGGALLLSAIPAGASNAQVSTVGSFTTYALMHALFPTSLNDLLPGGSTTHQKIAATATQCTGGKTYSSGTPVPNGSTAGKTALHGEETAVANEKGCVTFVRSSSPPEGSGGSTTFSTHFDYYAYALDGVAPMVGANAGGTVTGAPAAFTLAELRGIYHCTTGHTNWHTLGGSTGTIVRFWPQSGSGTRSVYADILGFTPAKSTGKGTCATPAITAFTVSGHTVSNEENTESGLVYATKVLHDTIKDAIFVYSAGKFVSQWNNVTEYGPTGHNRISSSITGNFTSTKVEFASIRQRKTTGATTSAGTPEKFVNFTATTSGRTTLKAGVNTATVTEGNEWYSHIPANADPAKTSTSRVPGVRYVYNVCDTKTPGYGVCKSMVGFDNQNQAQTGTQTTGLGTKSRLCAGEDATTIQAQGFVALTRVGHPRTSTMSNVAGATCREFQGKNYPGLGVAKSWAFDIWVAPTDAGNATFTGVVSLTGIATVPVRSTLSITLTTSGATTFSGYGALSDGADSLFVHVTGTYGHGTPSDNVTRLRATSGGRLKLTTSTLKGCEVTTMPAITFAHTAASGNLVTTTPLTGAVAAQNPTSSTTCTSFRKSMLNGDFSASQLSTSYFSGSIT